jgi:Tfp pilus assembly protein PilN
MIKINLVPVKEKKKRKEALAILGAVMVLLIEFLGMTWYWIKLERVKSDLNTQIEEVKKESDSYQDKINEMKDLEAKEASLETFKKMIKGISETQRKVIVAVDQLAMLLPDGVWLTNLIQGRGNDANKFTVAGFAFTKTALENYFEAVSKPSPLLKGATLNLKSISASAGKNPQIQQFEINVTVADQGS